MENGKMETEDKVDGVPEDNEENVKEVNLEIAQLQGLVAELQEGLHAALTDLHQLRHRDQGLEEKVHANQTDVDNKIMGLKNTFNTFKEELNVALFHIKDVSSRQREIQKRIELLQSENTKHIISVQHRVNNGLRNWWNAQQHLIGSFPRGRRNSKADVPTASEDDHICVSSQSDLSVSQHFFSSLPQRGSPQRGATLTQSSASEQETQQQQRGCLSKRPVWGERRSSRDETETHSNPTENSNRQRVALDLLESERVYVSHLSLLLKANISFNGSEALTCKDKRPFPSSLRFLIQQHLELLHTLQERVLKCQWQGIMGDVFMRLTSKESEFLDFYVSYLKELPECLSVISRLASSSMTSAFLETDITGDESKPSLHNLLLQPVQRIPDYLLLLQGLLKQTEPEHPDYYLLLVCIQQFRSFTAQYQQLLQHNQELLLHNRKRSSMNQLLKTVESGMQANNIGSPYPCSSAMLEHANQVKQSKQRLLEHIQSHRFQNWEQEQDSDPQFFDAEWPSQLPYFNPDLESWNPKCTGLGIIPESEASERSMSCQHHKPSTPAEGRHVQPGSALADALGEFLLPPDPPGMESLFEEDRGSFPDISVFDQCSSASSDSSIDIAFVKCPKAPPASHHAMAVNLLTTRDVFAGGISQGNGYSRVPNRGCVSPDESIMMRHNQHRPLQASQRKSKSLNGLQMDNTVSGLDGGPLSDHLQRVGGHAKLERQGSKGSKGCSTPSRKIQSPLCSRVDPDKQSDDLHGLLSIDPGFQSWGDESKWRTEENNHTQFSERSRKQDKGGFRSSFKKLFKKKSGDEKKEKGGDRTPENQSNGEHETSGKNSKLVHLEINRGTAV